MTSTERPSDRHGQGGQDGRVRRILILCPHLPPRACGIADYLTLILADLVRPGLDITVAHAEWDAMPLPGVRTVRLPAVAGRRFVNSVRQVIGDVGPHILNIHYETAMYDHRATVNMLPWLLRRSGFRQPIVTTFHDFFPPHLFPKAAPIRPAFVHFLARHIDHAIVTNAVDRRAAVERFHIAPERISVIPVGNNMVVPSRCQPDDSFTVGCFGLVMPTKGIEEAVEAVAIAARSIPEIKLRIIGSDRGMPKYRRELDAFIERAGIADRVHFTGELSREDVIRELASLHATLMLFPGEGVTTRRTSFLTAMACGLPTITAQGAILPDGLEDGRNCLLVPLPVDPNASAAALVRLARSPELARDLESGAKAWAEDYTYPKIAEAYAALFERLAGEPVRA